MANVIEQPAQIDNNSTLHNDVAGIALLPHDVDDSKLYLLNCFRTIDIHFLFSSDSLSLSLGSHTLVSRSSHSLKQLTVSG